MLSRTKIVLVCAFLHIALFLPGAAAPVFANEKALHEFLENIQLASDKVHSFYSSFTQEKQLALFSSPVLFQGKLYIDRPDKLRWEFFDPVPSALLFNGNEGARCDEQMVLERFSLKTDPVMGMVAKQLWIWLGGDYHGLDKSYLLQKKGTATLVVTPVDNESAQFISSVKITFDETVYQPKKVEITETGGDLTIIVFDDPVINSDLPAELFTECSND